MAGPAELPAAPRVLLAGIARSGTTWIANALSHCAGATLVHEPDNDRHHVHAMAAKARLGRYPVLEPGDAAPAYARLFDAAFTDPRPDPVGDRRRALARRLAGDDAATLNRVMGDPDGHWPLRLRAARMVTAAPVPGDPVPGPRIVKTVHAALGVDWLLSTLRPDAAFVVVRHPANVIGSWRDLGWDLVSFPWRSQALWRTHGPPDGGPGPGRPDDLATRAAWHFALVANALVAAAERHGLVVVDHEDVLEAPACRLADLAATVGLTWTDEAEAWVRDRDRPGEGYDIHRVAADERGRWRTRLPEDELRLVADVVRRFPRLRDRWDLDLGARTPALRARWVVGPVRTAGPDEEGWSRVTAAIDGSDVSFAVRDVAPAPRIETFLTLAAPPALVAGVGLETDDPVDTVWAEGAGRALQVLARRLGVDAVTGMHGPRLDRRPAARTGARTGLWFTGGVDSFWSLLRGGHEPTDLVAVWGDDLALDDAFRVATPRAMLDDVAAHLGLDVVCVETEALHHPHAGRVDWELHPGVAVAAVAIVLSDHLDRLVVPPRDPPSSADQTGARAALDPLWSVPGAVEIVHPSSEQTRLERVVAIADEPLVHQHLRVCGEGAEPGTNCGRCERCVRTMVMLAIAGRLDAVRTLPDAEGLPAAIGRLVPLPRPTVALWTPLADERLPGPLRAAVQAALDGSLEPG